MESARRLDLRRDGGDRPALEARAPRPRTTRLQPVELRSRRVLPRPREVPRGSARLLVGADVAVDGAGPVRHRRGRHRDPDAATAARDRCRLLAHLRRRDGAARRERALDDRALARRADHGLGLLVAARDLAGDPDLPLLHDHRPEDDSRWADRPPRLRGRGRAARDPADRAADDRVRHEGRRADRARARVRGARRRQARRREATLGAVRAPTEATRRGDSGARRARSHTQAWSSPPESRLVRRPGLTSASPACRAFRRSRSSTRAASRESTTALRRRSPATSSSTSAPSPMRSAPGTSSGPRTVPAVRGSRSLWQRIRNSAGRPVVVATLRARADAADACTEVRTRARRPSSPASRARWSRRRMRRTAAAARQPPRDPPPSGGRSSSRSSTGRYVVVGSAGGGLPAPAPAPAATGADRARRHLARERRRPGRAALHARARSTSASRTT